MLKDNSKEMIKAILLSLKIAIEIFVFIATTLENRDKR
jgi:hypothetical protein